MKYQYGLYSIRPISEQKFEILFFQFNLGNLSHSPTDWEKTTSKLNSFPFVMVVVWLAAMIVLWLASTLCANNVFQTAGLCKQTLRLVRYTNIYNIFGLIFNYFLSSVTH